MRNEYVYFCDDCNCMVDENHRCQQWNTVHAIPVQAISKLKILNKNIKSAKEILNDMYDKELRSNYKTNFPEWLILDAMEEYANQFK